MAESVPAPYRTATPFEQKLLARRGRSDPLWLDVLGEQLRRRRHELGETLSETAGRAGISPQYLSEVERGLKEPSSEMIAAVGGALKVTLLDLTLAVADSVRAPQSMRSPASRQASILVLAA